jgi:hypothetical protein
MNALVDVEEKDYISWLYMLMSKYLFFIEQNASIEVIQAPGSALFYCCNHNMISTMKFNAEHFSNKNCSTQELKNSLFNLGDDRFSEM